MDLALAIGAVPIRRIGMRRLQLDAMILGPPLKIAERLLRITRMRRDALRDAITPGLLGLWRQQIRLDSSLAEGALGVHWTGYQSTLTEAAQWFTRAADAR